MGGLSLFLSGNLCLTTYCHYKKQCFPALFTDTIFRVWFDGFSLISISYHCLLCKIDFPTSPVPLSYIYLQPVKCFISLDLSSSNSLMTVFFFFCSCHKKKKKVSSSYKSMDYLVQHFIWETFPMWFAACKCCCRLCSQYERGMLEGSVHPVDPNEPSVREFPASATAAFLLPAV